MTYPGPPVLGENPGRRSAAARAAITALEARRPRPRDPFRGAVRLFNDVWRKADRDRILGLAAEIAFMAVLSLFPALILVAAFLGRLGGLIGEANAARVEDEVLDAITRLLTDSAGPAVETARDLFNASGNALTLATALALVSVAQAFAVVVNTVTITYDVQDHRGWWYRRGLGLLIGLGSLVTGALVVTLVVVGPIFGRGVDVVSAIGLSDAYAAAWVWLRWPVALVALVMWAMALYHYCPGRPARWREALPGAALAAGLWLAASYGFNRYLELVVPASPVFGALGGGIILMTWLYLLSFSLLGGAELNAVLVARRAARDALTETGEIELGHG